MGFFIPPATEHCEWDVVTLPINTEVKINE
jgi:hypothetical protein